MHCRLGVRVLLLVILSCAVPTAHLFAAAPPPVSSSGRAVAAARSRIGTGDRTVPATPVGGASAIRLDGELNDAAWSKRAR